MLDGLGWEQLQDRRGLGADAGRDGRRADHHGRAVHDRHRADLDHHRAAARRARRRRLPDGRARRGAQRPALDDGRRRRPPERSRPASSSRTPPFLGAPPAGRHPGRVRAAGSRGAHLAGVRFTGTGCRRRSSPRSSRLLRAGEPFVYAYYDGIDKVAHEYGLGEHYDAELPAADRLVGDLLAVLPAGAVLAGHRRPRPGRRGRQRACTLAPEVLGHVPDAVGRGPVPLAARPARARRRRCSTPPSAPPRRRGLGAHPRAGDRRRAGSGRRSADAAAARLGDVALVARRTSPSIDPADTGRRAGRPARLADRGRDARAAARRHRRSTPRPPWQRWPACQDPDVRPPRRRPTEPVDRAASRRHRGRARRGRERRRRRSDEQTEVGRAAGQGHADRLDDQAAARGGAPGRRSTRPAATGCAEIYETSVDELADGAVARPARRARPPGPPVRRDERRPTEAELRIAQAQLVGWLEGLFHGIQATLFAQQMAARQQLEEMRRQLPPGRRPRRAPTAERGPAPTSDRYGAPDARWPRSGVPDTHGGGGDNPTGGPLDISPMMQILYRRRPGSAQATLSARCSSAASLTVVVLAVVLETGRWSRAAELSPDDAWLFLPVFVAGLIGGPGRRTELGDRHQAWSTRRCVARTCHLRRRGERRAVHALTRAGGPPSAPASRCPRPRCSCPMAQRRARSGRPAAARCGGRASPPRPRRKPVAPLRSAGQGVGSRVG